MSHSRRSKRCWPRWQRIYEKLMMLDEPALRLKLVDDFLRGKGVVS